ncbi:MAG TPA: aminoglycoside phosphotransferase family protein, partial [Thermoanaerobaculia bacterium]|nr:aminoglycoside phosphotransferase family protein [Thermoanaerobaculia bacterium]
MKRTEVRTDSIVAEEEGIVVKTHRGEAAVRARHEFETLAALRAAMTAPYEVPLAIDLDEAAGSLTMERVDGIALDRMIHDAKRHPHAVARLEMPVRRAGEWLRAMQEATRVADRSAAQQILAEQTAAAIARATAQFPAPLARRVAARLHELRSHVAPHTLSACGHHGDYWPGNVFPGERRTTVIDFEGYRLGLPLEDVAYFLIQIEILATRHLRLVAPLRHAFLEGYDGAVDDDALALFTLTRALHLIARDAAARHPLVIAIWMRRTLRDIVRRT